MVLATQHCVRQVGKSVWCQISATSLTNAESGFGIQYALTTKKHEELVEAMMRKLQERGDVRRDIDIDRASHFLFSMKSKLFLNFIASRTISLSQHREDVCQAVGFFLTGVGAASAGSAGIPRQKPLPVARLQLSSKA